MNRKTLVTTLTLAMIGAVSTTTVDAAPVLDGSGFSGPSANVTYDPTAPSSNFGTPGSTTSGAAYGIETRSDATYAYVLVSQTAGGGGSAAGTFANLYFGTGAGAAMGSDVGFEVTNSDVFNLDTGKTTSTAGTGIEFAALDNGTQIEFAVPFSYFETDPQNIGFGTTTATNPDIILRLSQSFGYSVAGGASYGSDRLGLIVDPSSAVPEPLSCTLLATGLIGLGFVRRQQRSLVG